jgi:acyl transferase domain-containing protein/acyl carrier protein
MMLSSAFQSVCVPVTKVPLEREPIAIIGMGCRFPGGASSPEAFWDLLSHGVDAICDVPPERWDWRRFYDPDPEKPGKMYVKRGGFLKEPVTEFDPLFFGISPREAAAIDPQQRLLMEVTYEALEDAGLRLESLRGSATGVFIGAFAMDMTMLRSSIYNRDQILPTATTGGSMTLLSNRLSYVFDWHGPSLSLDTACSSGLVSTHYACQSLLNRECDLAVAGGANVMLRPEYFMVMCRGGFLSPDGKCMTFDARGNGYVRGEGAGVVVLKRLSDALKEHDPIYAILRGSGVNQDGQTPGISFPSQAAQEQLIERVCAQAGVLPAAVSYVEAHGTGTRAGDPVEAKALENVFSRGRVAGRKCLVGSVKSNIGHLEAAAGVAGLMKAALALKYKTVPPNLHFETPNPDIPFDRMCLKVPITLEPWPDGDVPAYASVNSFGYGGTNAHALLQEAPKQISSASEVVRPVHRPLLLPVSARSEEALRAVAQRYHEFLTRPERHLTLEDLAYTLSLRRSHHDRRAAIMANEIEDFVAGLRALAKGEPSPFVSKTDAVLREGGPCVFVYTGMGPQWWGMGRELLESEPVFRAALKRCDGIFSQFAPWRLMDVFTCPAEHSRIGSTEVAQPANLALQVALTALWESWGVRPAAVVGHSIGEVAAAYVSGALTLEDALTVSYHRSRLQQTRAGMGGMLAVGLSESEAMDVIAAFRNEVSVAAVNSASSVTLAGDEKTLRAVACVMEDREVFHRFLKVEVAYHSYQMDPLECELRRALATVRPSATLIPFYSSVTGKQMNGCELDANYWWRNIRETVRFREAMESLSADDHRLFVEVGPHPVLAQAIKESLEAAGVKGETVASLHREKPERRRMLMALGTLYSAGNNVAWNAVSAAYGEFVKLPAYPWQRSAHWFESLRSKQDRLGSGSHVFLNEDLQAPSPTWEVEANDAFFPYLKDHVIDHTVVFPGAAYVESGLAVHRQMLQQTSYRLEEITLHKLLALDAKDCRVLRLQYDASAKRFAVYSRSKSEGAVWELHASGRLMPGHLGNERQVSLNKLFASCPEEIPATAFYKELQRSGFFYGPTCQTLTHIRIGLKQALGRIQMHPSLLKELPETILHPTILDGAFQLGTLLVEVESARPWVPVSVERIHVHHSPGDSCWAHSRVIEQSSEVVRTELTLMDADGRVLVECESTSRVLAAPMMKEAVPSCAYRLDWRLMEAEAEELRPAAQPGCWVIAGDSGFSRQLCKHLESRGLSYYNLSCGPTGDEASRLGGLLTHESLIRVVFIAGQSSAFSFARATDECTALMTLVQGIAPWPAAEAVRLAIVTHGCQAITPDDATVDIAASPLWGLGRVIRHEYPHFGCTLIDLESGAEGQAPTLVEHFVRDLAEPEIALRGSETYVARLATAEFGGEAPQNEPYQSSTREPVELEIGVPGRLDTIRYRTAERRAPGPGEVEIEVHASALNFKDLLKAIGTISSGVLKDTYFGDAFGMECAGVVTRVGESVTGIRPGDEVIASPKQGSFRSYVTSAKEFVYPKPHSLRMEEAPNFTGFLTAYYGLVEVGRLRAGEKVLIHNATGGVGLAAVQVARWIGAEIFATAGTEEKRQYLRALGIAHVMDSRTLRFAEEVKRTTADRGVDVVLNAMSGDALMKSFALLAPYGRFVEIGKQDIAENSGLPMNTFYRNVSFSAVDLDRMFQDRVPALKHLIAAVCAGFERGEFTAIPVQVFPASEAEQAFRFMAKSKHIGKIVMNMHDQGITVHRAQNSQALVKADGTYLITGGTRGFGLEIAKWLAARGARHLVLVSRSGALSPEARHTVMVLRGKGIEVRVRAVDMANEEQVGQLFAEIDEELLNLRGVFHGAMVLDDRLLAGLTPDAFERVMAPKVMGAWLLHKHTANRPLDLFVMLSSMSSLVGNVGQGNYAAANAFLDHFSSYRRRLGLPAFTVNWGALAEVGVAARNPALEQQLASIGIGSLPIRQALGALERVLETGARQTDRSSAASNFGVFDLDWHKWATVLPEVANLPIFQEVMAASVKSHQGQTLTPVMRMQCKLALLDQQERLPYLVSILAEALAQVLQLPVSQIGPEDQITALGLDSLMTVELRNSLQSKYGLEISTVALLKGGSISHLANQALVKLEPELAGIDVTDWLSDEELNNLLGQELETAAAPALELVD